MGRKVEAPITREVLEWAIKESGLSIADLATGVNVDEVEVRRWLSGDARPGITELKHVASKLHRQVAVFLLPAPPETRALHVRFRHPIGAQRQRELTPNERRFLRRAKRLQDAESWLSGELEREPADVPLSPLSANPSSVASSWRERLSVSIETQLTWRSASMAFDAWRDAIEATGITVVQLSMGEDAIRGFSLWDDASPLIAVNTAWIDEARSFTLFHELGHLVTRTDSACASAPMIQAGDSTERWCEAFAAALLIPAEALSAVRRVDRMAALAALARRFKVSLRATAVRLIDLDRASWSLYDKIPPISDAKKKGGGGTGRNRSEMRVDEFGHRTTRVFLEAVQRDIISESQALDYLDIPSSDFDRLAAATGR